MNIRDDWKFRGLVHQVTDEGVLDRLSKGGVTAYIGFDPTASSLHLGSLIQILNLRRLQQAGNRPIALAGGGTGLIGDPSFKAVERPLLSDDQLQENIDGIRGQLSRFLDFTPGAGKAQGLLLNNADWLTKLSLTEFLRDTGKHFTVNQMIAKDSVKSRLDRDDVGISFTEFTYMLLQAYDFLRLNIDHDCTVQLGGSDQWGNITMGTELIRKITGKSSGAGITSPLLLKSDGTKFGKTESGENVWLDAERTSPFQMHQYLLNADDAMTPLLLRYFTFLDHDTIRSLDDAIKSAPQERAAQRTLANEVVALVHGEDAAKNAERAGEALFSEEIASLDEKTLLQVVSDAPSSKMTRSELSAGIDIVDLLIRCELASSKGEARRFLEQGGVYINNQRVDATQPVDSKSILHDRYMVVRRGRKQMNLVVIA